MDFNLLKNILTENNSFLITTHVNPDADAICSEIVLHLILKSLGKEVHVINHSIIPYNLTFLNNEGIVKKFDKAVHSEIFNTVDVLIAVDVNRSDRLVGMERSFIDSNKIKLYIDHHQDPQDFTDHAFLDQSYCATGHILYDFIIQTGIVEMNYILAFNLYTAIMTDTGSFRFERTTPDVHRIAAKLLEYGVNPSQIYDAVYDQSKLSKLKLFGRAVNSLKLFGEREEIAYMNISYADLQQTGAFEYDTDGFVNHCLSIEGVKIGILFLELKDEFKVSFRSKGKIPIHKLAAEYGGGGHLNAAGVRIRNAKLDDHQVEILNKALSYLNQ